MNETKEKIWKQVGLCMENKALAGEFTKEMVMERLEGFEGTPLTEDELESILSVGDEWEICSAITDPEGFREMMRGR